MATLLSRTRRFSTEAIKRRPFAASDHIDRAVSVGGPIGRVEHRTIGQSVDTRLDLFASKHDAVGVVRRSNQGFEPADVVVLHRVVCCYPDYQRLLGAAASHAGRLLVFSHPPPTPPTDAVPCESAPHGLGQGPDELHQPRIT